MTEHKHEWQIFVDCEAYCTICKQRMSDNPDARLNACEELSAEDARGIAEYLASRRLWGRWVIECAKLRAYAERLEGK